MACETKYITAARDLVFDIKNRRVIASEFWRLDLYPNYFAIPFQCNEKVGVEFIAKALAFLDYVKAGGHY